MKTPRSLRSGMARWSCSVLPVAAASMLLVGCGGGGSETKTASPNAKTAKAYEIPLHKSAVALPDKSGPGREAYHVGIPVDGLANFYTLVGKMGDKVGFVRRDQKFDWCSGSRKDTPPRGFERVWRRSGTSDFLVLQATEDGPGSVLVIIDDKADGSRTC